MRLLRHQPCSVVEHTHSILVPYDSAGPTWPHYFWWFLDRLHNCMGIWTVLFFVISGWVHAVSAVYHPLIAEQHHYQSASLLASRFPFQFRISRFSLPFPFIQVSTLATSTPHTYSGQAGPFFHRFVPLSPPPHSFNFQIMQAIPLFFLSSAKLGMLSCFVTFCYAMRFFQISLWLSFASYLFPFSSDQGFLSLLWIWRFHRKECTIAGGRWHLWHFYGISVPGGTWFKFYHGINNDLIVHSLFLVCSYSM